MSNAQESHTPQQKHFQNMRLLGLIRFISVVPAILAALECRPDGPTVPRARHLANSSFLAGATENLTAALDQAVAGEIAAGWAVENASFSVALVDYHQDDPGIPVWEYHHLAKGNVNGTDKLDRDSQYLIGSVSKVFSTLVLLLSDVQLDEPLTKYLPELSNSSSTLAWDEVTLRSLANHLSGAPTNCEFPNIIFLGVQGKGYV